MRRNIFFIIPKSRIMHFLVKHVLTLITAGLYYEDKFSYMFDLKYISLNSFRYKNKISQTYA